MRLFIAIEFPKETKKEITQVIAHINLPTEISWIKSENLHLTLKFLGYTKIPLKKIEESIEASISEIKPWKFEFISIGYFDYLNLIIWLGVKRSEILSRLVDKIEKEMLSLGFAKEKRIFSPHITIGRGKNLPTDIRKKIILILADQRGNALPKPFQVKEIFLMESKLTPKRPIYTRLFKFTLA